MKLTKDELKTKVSELIEDNDKAIELLEDIEDSVDTSANDELQGKLDEVQGKLDDLTEKYKQRFLQGEPKDVAKDETKDELKEENIIDIKEI